MNDDAGPGPGLADSEAKLARLQAALESVSDGVYAVDSDWRIVIFNRADQQAFCVVRIRRHHHLDAAYMREDAFRTLRMGLPTANAAAAGRADRHRRPEVTTAAVAQAGECAR